MLRGENEKIDPFFIPFKYFFPKFNLFSAENYLFSQSQLIKPYTLCYAQTYLTSGEVNVDMKEGVGE